MATSVSVDARLVAAAQRAARTLASQTGGRVDLFVPPLGGVRTQDEQQELYDQGRSFFSTAPVVTGTLNSKHLTGRAIDLGWMLDGKRLDPSVVPLQYWNYLALLMAQALPSVRWGGLWTSRDLAHFELP